MRSRARPRRGFYHLTPAGTYVVLACADDTLLVGESREVDDCRPSATPLVVSP